MNLIDALKDMKECKFSAFAKMHNYEMDFRNGEEMEDRAKGDLIRRLAKSIIVSDKVSINKEYRQVQQEMVFGTEVYVFTREELEQLVMNVEIYTRQRDISLRDLGPTV